MSQDIIPKELLKDTQVFPPQWPFVPGQHIKSRTNYSEGVSAFGSILHSAEFLLSAALFEFLKVTRVVCPNFGHPTSPF